MNEPSLAGVKQLLWPLPGPSRRLVPNKLISEQRHWLGAKINGKQFTPVERFKIKVRTISECANELRKGIPNHVRKVGSHQ
jgi:hypothetical protein